jgi:hypothetical protein
MAYSGSPEDKLALFLGASSLVALGGIFIYAVYSSVKWFLKKTTQAKDFRSRIKKDRDNGIGE